MQWSIRLQSIAVFHSVSQGVTKNEKSETEHTKFDIFFFLHLSEQNILKITIVLVINFEILFLIHVNE